MFRPPSLLVSQIVPTAAVLPQGSRDFYFRAERASLPLHAPDMLTVRIQVIDGTRTFTLLDSQPCRLLILPSCYSSYGALNFYPGGTFTHCSCQPSLDAHLPGLILWTVVSEDGAAFVPSSQGTTRSGDHSRLPLADCPAIRKVLGNLPVPQNLKVPKSLYQAPS